MKKSVIVISDRNSHVAPEISTILRDSGFIVLAEGSNKRPASITDDASSPVAIVCQLPPNLDVKRLLRLAEQTRASHPKLPLIACAETTSGGQTGWRELVAQAGFNAIADSAAQLPPLLREVEEHEPADEPQPFKAPPDDTALTVIDSLRTPQLRGAFALTASLHLAASQAEAASFSIGGLARLVHAARWTIFVAQDNAGPGMRLASIASRSFDLENLSFDRDWRIESLAGCVSSEQPASRAALESITTLRTVRRSEAGKRILATPLVTGQRVIGVVEGMRMAPARSFTTSDIRLLEAVASSIALALSNSVRIAEAERLSLTDELTRLHNARYLRQFLVNEIKRARRYHTKVAALFLDLDDFKRVNDLHGHLAGSHCLMEVAALLLPSVRDTDCVVRYGGDEFVIILPEAGPDDAAIVAERIRAKIESHRFTGGRRLQVSLTA
ncbi:MAG TPA: diguanylate cyclase, partial [Pyrinomonadaceae bacterium]|nr:diguanylate cyclase [Pyrinomonadaceae bacterium]